MSSAASRMVSLSARAVVAAAAEGRLPGWVEVTPERRQHMARVAELMGEWATRLGLSSDDRTRWRATGWLHDSLRDADAERLRPGLDAPFRDLPVSFLHGPAAAMRLEAEGVEDDEMLDAIRYHTLGRANPGRLGRMLIMADFLEPGRSEEPAWRASLRSRMPEAEAEVFAAVVGTRLRLGLERGKPLRPEFVEMWNTLVRS